MLSATLPLLAFLSSPSVLAADVPCPASVPDMDSWIERALDAYSVMDTDAFFQAHRNARAALTCMEELLEPEDVAGYHGVAGLAAFLTEDDEGTLASFAAALSADPTWQLPERVAPTDSVLVELQAQAVDKQGGPVSPMGETESFFLMVDGEPSLEHPKTRPWVLQVADEDWQVLWSGALAPGEGLPHAALNPERYTRGSTALAQALGDEGGYDRRTAQRLGYGAAGFGAAGLGLFVASGISKAMRTASQKQCIEDAACVADEDSWTDRMDGLHHRSVAFGWTGAGCMVAGAGLGVGAVIEGRF